MPAYPPNKPFSLRPRTPKELLAYLMLVVLLGLATAQLPTVEERLPVDVLDDVSQVKVVDGLRAEHRGRI